MTAASSIEVAFRRIGLSHRYRNLGSDAAVQFGRTSQLFGFLAKWSVLKRRAQSDSATSGVPTRTNDAARALVPVALLECLYWASAGSHPKAIVADHSIDQDDEAAHDGGQLLQLKARSS